MNNITFRDAIIEDLEIIVEIYNSTITSRMVTADTEPVTIEDRLDWFKNHTPDKRPLWMIENNGEICGWVSFETFYGRPAYDRTVELSIYLHENSRSKGLGKEILSKVLDEAPKLGIDTLLGFIFAHNEPSLKLVSSLGFEKWAHLPEVAELDGVKRDLVIMGKKIIKI